MGPISLLPPESLAQIFCRLRDDKKALGAASMDDTEDLPLTLEDFVDEYEGLPNIHEFVQTFALIPTYEGFTASMCDFARLLSLLHNLVTLNIFYTRLSMCAHPTCCVPVEPSYHLHRAFISSKWTLSPLDEDDPRNPSTTSSLELLRFFHAVDQLTVVDPAYDAPMTMPLKHHVDKLQIRDYRLVAVRSTYTDLSAAVASIPAPRSVERLYIPCVWSRRLEVTRYLIHRTHKGLLFIRIDLTTLQYNMQASEQDLDAYAQSLALDACPGLLAVTLFQPITLPARFTLALLKHLPRRLQSLTVELYDSRIHPVSNAAEGLSLPWIAWAEAVALRSAVECITVIHPERVQGAFLGVEGVRKAIEDAFACHGNTKPGPTVRLVSV